MAQEKNFLGEGRFLISNKATLIGTIGVEDEPAVKMLQVASSRCPPPPGWATPHTCQTSSP